MDYPMSIIAKGYIYKGWLYIYIYHLTYPHLSWDFLYINISPFKDAYINHVEPPLAGLKELNPPHEGPSPVLCSLVCRDFLKQLGGTIRSGVRSISKSFQIVWISWTWVTSSSRFLILMKDIPNHLSILKLWSWFMMMKIIINPHSMIGGNMKTYM